MMIDTRRGYFSFITWSTTYDDNGHEADMKIMLFPGRLFSPLTFSFCGRSVLYPVFVFREVDQEFSIVAVVEGTKG